MATYRDLAFDNHFEQFLAIVMPPNRPSFDTEICWFIAYPLALFDFILDHSCLPGCEELGPRMLMAYVRKSWIVGLRANGGLPQFS